LDNLKKFLFTLFDFKEVERQATIEAIKINVSSKGVNAWALNLAVFAAVIGLNADSTVVVIGAMLIPPLMRPILGNGIHFL
jgi:uncharacterized membrane protein